MSNSTPFYTNITVIKVNKGVPVKAVISMAPSFFFFYINVVMLVTLRSETTFRETPRYILFANTLFADSLNLLFGLLLYVFAVGKLYLTGTSCLIVVTIAGVSTRISPLNLAVMSLERYIAVCYPLRHAEITTIWRTGMTISVTWAVGSLQSLTDLLVFAITGSSISSVSGFCSRNLILALKVHDQINITFTVIYFLMVGVIILYTYIITLMAAKSVTTDKGFTVKARKTVLLHLFQLGIYLASLPHDSLITLAFAHMDWLTALNIQYFLFLSLVIFPRCLSPLIYGLRDQIFRPFFRYYFTFGLGVKPIISD